MPISETKWNEDSPEFRDMLAPEALEILDDKNYFIFDKFRKIQELPVPFTRLGLEMAGDICDDCGNYIPPVFSPEGGGTITRGECSCVKEKRRQAEQEADRRRREAYLAKKVLECGIPITLQEASFDNFRVRDWNKVMVDAAREYIRIWPQPMQGEVCMGLTFTGSTGIGKSHMAAVIVKEIIMKGYDDVLFIPVEKFLDDIKETFDGDYNRQYKATKSDIMEKICTASLLVFDDLMANSTTEWAMHMIEQVYDRRSSTRRPTITTSNFSEKQLKAMLADARQERLFSRIAGYSVMIDLGDQRDERLFNKGLAFDSFMKNIAK